MGTLSITGGTLRSRRLRAPRGRGVRPTPARVKEALFSILAPKIVDARILDLFAGTGSLGFEALSRGAASATFVESDRETAARLRDAAAALGVGDRATVLQLPAERAIGHVAGPYDIVFADPPYAQAPPEGVFAALRAADRLDGDAVLVYEHSARVPAPALAGFTLERTARYGEVGLAFYAVTA